MILGCKGKVKININHFNCFNHDSAALKVVRRRDSVKRTKPHGETANSSFPAKMSRRRNAIPNINSNNAKSLVQTTADIGKDEALVTNYEESLQSMCSSSRNPQAQFPIRMEINGRQGEALIRDIIRRSETVLQYENMALTLQNDWEPSSWTYTFRSQVHSGGRKEMGGRPTGTTVHVRRHFKSLLFSVMSSKMIDPSARNEITLTDFFESSSIMRLQENHSRGLCNLYNNFRMELSF